MSEWEFISRKEAGVRGLKRYFTGKPCKRGHICERYALGCGCCECRKEGRAKWEVGRHSVDERFRKRRIDAKARYIERNRDAINERNRRDYARQRAALLAMEMLTNGS